MTVIVTSNGSGGTKTAPQTTTIAKALKANTSNVTQVQNQHHLINNNQHHQHHHQLSNGGGGGGGETGGLITTVVQQTANKNEQNSSSTSTPNIPQHNLMSEIEAAEAATRHNEFASVSSKLPNFTPIDLENNSIQLPSNCTIEDVKKFEELYKNNCAKILETVLALKLNAIEEIWLQFWRCSTSTSGSYLEEQQLSSDKLYSLCQVKQIVKFVKHSDFQFYQFCVEILIPDVLSSLPAQLVQSIRALAKNLETWLLRALVKCPDEMRQAKLLVINTFSMTLRRYTSLNHLAQTVKNSLQNGNILEQMLHDINKVDFNYIKEQATFICQCDGKLISKFEKEFKETLRATSSSTSTATATAGSTQPPQTTTNTVDQWIQWLDNSVTFYLQQYEGTPKYAEMARQFLLKWSFFW